MHPILLNPRRLDRMAICMCLDLLLGALKPSTTQVEVRRWSIRSNNKGTWYVTIQYIKLELEILHKPRTLTHRTMLTFIGPTALYVFGFTPIGSQSIYTQVWKSDVGPSGSNKKGILVLRYEPSTNCIDAHTNHHIDASIMLILSTAQTGSVCVWIHADRLTEHQ